MRDKLLTFEMRRAVRDLIMGANTISIRGSVGNDLYAAASSSTLTGRVGRDIKASISRLVIDGPVGGDIGAHVGELVFGSSARVTGKVSYTSEVVEAQITGNQEY